MARTTLADLPNELLLEIASHLTLSSLIQLQNVNSKWRAVVAAARPEPVSEFLLLVYNTVSEGCDMERPSATPVPALTDADRVRYIAAIDNCVNRPALLDKRTPNDLYADLFFRTWLLEWPSHAAINGVSPASLVSAFFDRTQYHRLDGALVYFPNNRILFSMTALFRQVILTRVPLTRVPGRGSDVGLLRCEPLTIANSEDWARFLPLFTPRRTGQGIRALRGQDQEEPIVPLYVFSGSGIGKDLAGNIVMVDKDGYITEQFDHWGHFLLGQCISMFEECNEYMRGYKGCPKCCMDGWMTGVRDVQCACRETKRSNAAPRIEDQAKPVSVPAKSSNHRLREVLVDVSALVLFMVLVYTSTQTIWTVATIAKDQLLSAHNS